MFSFVLTQLDLYFYFISAEWTYVKGWSICSATCGGGVQTRIQSCVYADNATADGLCSDSAVTETQDCNTLKCRKLLAFLSYYTYLMSTTCAFRKRFFFFRCGCPNFEVMSSPVFVSILLGHAVYSCKWK